MGRMSERKKQKEVSTDTWLSEDSTWTHKHFDGKNHDDGIDNQNEIANEHHQIASKPSCKQQNVKSLVK